MKIKNLTLYNTIELKRSALSVVKELGANPKNILLVIAYRKRNGRIWGVASGKNDWRWCSITVYVTKPEYEMQGIREFKQIMNHEVHHILGVGHKDMSHECYINRNQYPDEQGIFTLKEEKDKQKVDLQLKRYNHAVKMFEVWNRKIRIANGRSNHWKKRVKYYDKVLSENGKMP